MTSYANTPEYVRSVEEDEGIESAFIDACRIGLLDLMQEYINRGVSIEASSQNGTTALMFASGFGRHKAVKELLRLGADVNAVNQESLSPLLYAVGNGVREVDVYKTINLLLEAGADKTQLNSRANTAFDQSLKDGYSAKIYDLLKIDEEE